MGFTFGFPIEQLSVNKGFLKRWTKEGFGVRGLAGMPGKDIIKMMNEALQRQGLGHVTVSALANDTVAAQVALAFRKLGVRMGFILGTGSNTSVSMPRRMVTKLGKPKPGESDTMLINMESGNFDGVEPNVDDQELDRQSKDPGQQVYEKMVSGKYLGELVRLKVQRLSFQTDLFAGWLRAPAFRTPYQLKSEALTHFAKDSTPDLKQIDAWLKARGIKASSLEERQALRRYFWLGGRAIGAVGRYGRRGDPNLCGSRHDPVPYRRCGWQRLFAIPRLPRQDEG